MSIHLGKYCAFGMKLQVSQGSYLAPDVWLAHEGTEGITHQPNPVVLNQADQVGYESKVYSGGKWSRGPITIPLVPGYTSDLITWIMTRDSDNQGKWASILVDCVHQIKKLTDAKVRTCSIAGEAGGHVTAALEVSALLQEAGTTPSPVFATANPYIFSGEATLQVKTGGGSYTTDATFKRWSVDIDNMVEEEAEGMRCTDSYAPQTLYNLSGQRVTATFSRDFLTNSFFADFLAGTEGALKITLQRTSLLTVVIELPRLIYDANDAGSPGATDVAIEEGVTLRALGSLDGTTAPLLVT